MREWIQQWLGIEEILKLQHTIISAQINQQRTIKQIETGVSVTTPALGRIIAKLDPEFAGDELDPEKKKLSNDIGAKAIARLRAEHLARMHAEGKL